MTPWQKCPHCGKATEFREEFCTLCWSHRKKGKVLTEEQIATCQSRLAAGNARDLQQAEFGMWQKRLLIPAIFMTLWCAYWALSLLAPYLKYGVGLPEMVTGLLCMAAFGAGGFQAGGRKNLKLACALLAAASLTCVLVIGDYLLGISHDLGSHVIGVLMSCVRLALCGMILVSAVKLLHLTRTTC